ncbi:MAG: hypothetical protein CRN43_06975 [Candidatus Nephrothrix sp. EaCA]|nr:MAG: hypothetical protein CRN43_06975 [Candidatus Nephrothrix sp. EaCA]
MPIQTPIAVQVFRIVHIDNAEYLLTHGLFTKNHKQADPAYIGIGDTGLIAQRNDYVVGVNPPNGVLGEYIPFYFAPLSPMLLNIKTGHRGVTKRPQSEIVYIVCLINTIVENCKEWCFTDGHAKNAITKFYNDLENLDKIDWNIVKERQWSNTEDDSDRMRRKQAEFLVRHHVPVNCISCLVALDEGRKTFIEKIINRLRLKIPVLANPSNQFYY